MGEGGGGGEGGGEERGEEKEDDGGAFLFFRVVLRLVAAAHAAPVPAAVTPEAHALPPAGRTVICRTAVVVRPRRVCIRRTETEIEAAAVVAIAVMAPAMKTMPLR